MEPLTEESEVHIESNPEAADLKDKPLALSGIVYSRSFRSTYASVHVARLTGDDPFYTDPDEGDPVLIRLQIQSDNLTDIRSYCRRFCKQGDWLQIQKTADTSWLKVDESIETDWRAPRLVVDLHSLEQARAVLKVKEIHAWSMHQCQKWQQAYSKVKLPTTRAPPIWVDQPPPDSETSVLEKPPNDKKDIVRSGGHGSGLAKRSQGRYVARFLLRMMMEKLQPPGTKASDPSKWATETIDTETQIYQETLEYLQGGVLDVAGGCGLLSMALGLAGIPSTIVDPRESVGKLPRRDRKAWREALMMRSTNRCTELPVERKSGAQPPVRTATLDNTADRMDKLFFCQPVAPYEPFRAWFGAPPTNVDTSFRHPDQDQLEICDSNHDVLKKARAIVALHPDEATDVIVDMAVAEQIPFLIVPCCVFFRLFPSRRLDGRVVSTYEELLCYLQAKHPSIQRTTLPFTGKNTILWSTF